MEIKLVLNERELRDLEICIHEGYSLKDIFLSGMQVVIQNLLYARDVEKRKESVWERLKN